MTYLRALGLLVKAYKAARGVMPKGLDLLKMKMKARQKVIDAKKVIQFPKELQIGLKQDLQKNLLDMKVEEKA